MVIYNTLNKHFGSRFNNFKGDIGLEIETESKEDYTIPKFSFWDVHNDNSLRDIGREYVLKQPLDFEETLPKALTEFVDKTKAVKFIQNSITTSIHVHLNLLNDNFLTLGNFLTVYTLVENILIRYSGEDRLSNLFCLPICDAEDTYHNMLRLLEGVRDRKYNRLSFDIDRTKYGALNLSSLATRGSLEIRSFRGTTDTKLIYNWIGILYSILKFARQDGLVPPAIILAYKDKGTEILTDVFSSYRKDIRHPDEEKLLEKNFWYAANLAYSIQDWKKLELVPKKKKPSAGALDKESLKHFKRTFQELNFHEQRAVLEILGVEEEQQPEEVPTAVEAATGAQRGVTTGTINQWFYNTEPGRTTLRPRGETIGGPMPAPTEETRTYEHPATGETMRMTPTEYDVWIDNYWDQVEREENGEEFN